MITKGLLFPSPKQEAQKHLNWSSTVVKIYKQVTDELRLECKECYCHLCCDPCLVNEETAFPTGSTILECCVLHAQKRA